LKVIALKADLSALILEDQKPIRRKDVIPIASQPKNKTNRFELVTNNNMLITNALISKSNRSTLGSYLK